MRDINEPPLHEHLHLPKEECEQEGPDVTPVDVGVGENDHLVVADLSTSKSSARPAPIAAMRAWISVFFNILSIRARSTFGILPRIGRMA